MNILYVGLIIVLAIVALILVLLVLVQSDKGGGLAGSLGGMGGGANQNIGGRGTADILSRATTWFAVAFMALCLILNIIPREKTSGMSSAVKEFNQKKQANFKASPAAVLGNKSKAAPTNLFDKKSDKPAAKENK